MMKKRVWLVWLTVLALCFSITVFAEDTTVPTRTVPFNDSHVVCTGNWQNGGFWYSDIAGASITFEFYGTYIAWYGEKVFNRGIAEVYIDDQLVGEVNGYRPKEEGSVVEAWFTKDDLSLDYHTLEIVVTGKTDAPDGGCYVDVHRFEVQEVETYRVDATSSRIEYHVVENGNNTWSNSGVHHSNQKGDSITFRFYGTYIAWYGEKVYNRGISEVYIDDQFITEVDAYDPNPLGAQELFSKNDLSLDYHTLRIEVTGRASSGSDCYVDLYYFMVQDIPDPGIINDDNKYFATLAQKVDFTGGTYDDSKWTLRDGSDNTLSMASGKFVKTGTGYWCGIFTHHPEYPYGRNTIVQATVKVGDHTAESSLSRSWIVLRDNGHSLVNESQPGIWFGFANSSTLTVAVYGGAPAALSDGTYVEFDCGVDFSTAQKVEIHDNGEYINLYAYVNGERKMLASVYCGGKTRVRDGAGVERLVAPASAYVLDTGYIGYVAWDTDSEMDDFVISKKENFDFVKDDGEVCEDLESGEYTLKFYEPLDGSAYICALYDGIKLSRIYTITSQETTVNVTEGQEVRLLKYQDLTNIKPLSAAASY